MSESLLYTYLLFPLLIIVARVADVSLGTLRIILFTKGYKTLAPIIGFFEVFIWILVAKQIITDVPNIRDLASLLAYVAYATGYALGTYAGIAFDKRLSLGKVLVRVFVTKDNTELEIDLRKHKFGVTSVDAQGKDGQVKILFIVTNRTELDNCIEMINSHIPSAFFTIENVQTVKAGYFSEFGNRSTADRLTSLVLPVKRK